MPDSPQHIAELISLGMTIPTLVLSGAVVYFWASAVKRKPKTANDWFITGVVFGFIGSFLDNSYWFLPWTASFLEFDGYIELVKVGVFFNIFFRQGLGIFAAYCHLKAAELNSSRSMRFLNTMLVTSSLAGVFYAVIIMFIHLNR